MHIHSVLSPCADWEMTPRGIACAASDSGMDLISVTDHNHCGNQLAVSKAAAEKGICYIFGIEVQTQEEVHVLVYFQFFEQINSFCEVMLSRLPEIPNNPDVFGEQPVIDENEEVLSIFPWLLINSVQFSMEDVYQIAEDTGGFVVPAHVDSAHFSIYSQLGLIPDTVTGPVEVIDRNRAESIFRRSGKTSRGFLFNSDAHYLKDIGSRYTDFQMENVDYLSWKNAILQGEFTPGRKIL